MGLGESLCFSAMPAMSRAIWSAPPPVPAGMTNSIGRVGSQAACAGTAPATSAHTASTRSAITLMWQSSSALRKASPYTTRRGQAPFHAMTPPCAADPALAGRPVD